MSADVEHDNADDAEGVEGVEENEVAPPQPEKMAAAGSRSVLAFNDTIEIFPHKRLPHYDQGTVKAYAALKRNEIDNSNRYALICERDVLPRVRAVPSFVNIVNPSLVQIVASGVIFWEPSNEERYAFVYDNPMRSPLMDLSKQVGLGWKLDKLTEIIVKPMLGLLMDFRDKDFFHGGIRPDNIFSNPSFEQIVLGDCLATPPAYAQPVLFEPVWRSMADPAGRGLGRKEDDYYAFGVTLALLARSKDHMAGFSDEDIIKQKVRQGSYSSILRAERLPAPVIELLRGLLIDDESQRWGVDEIQGWLDGQRLSPKQSVRSVKVSRPVEFDGQEYFWPTILSMDLRNNPSEAVQMIANKGLEQWVERSLEDKMTKARLELVRDVPESAGHGGAGASRCLMQASAALEPAAPLRYKGMNFMPDGFSVLLYQAMASGADVAPFVDVIAQKMVSFWITMQGDSYHDTASFSSRFEDARLFLQQKTMGYGVERCIYFLAPDAPCLSPALKGYYVRTPADLLHALEEIAVQPDRPRGFVDRHIAAFLVVKERRLIERSFIELNSEHDYSNIRGNIKVIAAIQQKEKVGPLPGLSRWALDLLDPVLGRYHDRELREELKKKLTALAEDGELAKMVGILENPQLRRDDFNSFRRAMKEYDTLRREKGALEIDLSRPATFGKQTGYEVAAIFSAILAGIISMVFAFMAFG